MSFNKYTLQNPNLKKILLCLFCIGLFVLCTTGYCFAEGTEEETPTLFMEDCDDDDYTCLCNSARFLSEYMNAGCMSCSIIHEITVLMLNAVNTMYDPLIDLSKIVLVLGTAIWIAVYLLKTLSSFSTQDPAKVLDTLIIFCMKIAFAYAIVDAGFDFMIEYVVGPLLNIGFDIGGVFVGV